MTQVFTVQLNQTESAEHSCMVVTPGAQQIEGGETALVDHIAVNKDCTGRLFTVATMRGKRSAKFVPCRRTSLPFARQDVEPIVLDLVDPVGTGGRLLRGFGQTVRDGKAGTEGGMTHRSIAGS